MKIVVSINGANIGSTGRIVNGISRLANDNGYETYKAYPKSRNLLPIEKNDVIICNIPVKFLCTRLAYITGLNGCFAWLSTCIFIWKIKRIKPDILHLHNLHDSYINLPLLFRFVKKQKIKTVWTLHDCWGFTGHCPHFLYIDCNKWKDGITSTALLKLLIVRLLTRAYVAKELIKPMFGPSGVSIGQIRP